MESATATSEQGGPRSSAKPPTYLPPPPARERPFPPDAESSIKPRLGRAILNSSALISFRCFLLLLPPYPATPPVLVVCPWCTHGAAMGRRETVPESRNRSRPTATRRHSSSPIGISCSENGETKRIRLILGSVTVVTLRTRGRRIAIDAICSGGKTTR